MAFKTAILVLLISVVLLLMVKSAGSQVTSGPVQPLNPYRVLDTRQYYAMDAGTTLPVNTRLPGGATAASVNITVTEPEGSGYLTAWDGRVQMPTASIINFSPGQTIANFAIVPINTDGTFHLYASARTHVVVDVMGFVAGPDYGWVQPFTYAQGAFLSLPDRGMQLLDGRANIQTAINLIDSCQGAVLWHGDFPGWALIGAHRTACGSRGFGGVESMPYGTRITVTINGVNKNYELYWGQDNVSRNDPTGTMVPFGTAIILQTSQTADTVYFRYFRLI